LFVAHIVIETVDPSDESALREWWATAHAAHVDRAYDLRLSWEFTRASLSRPNAERKSVLLAAFDGEGRMVGSAKLQLSLQDNTHMAYADVDVPAGNRRGGVGSGLLTEIEARARVAGRTHLLGEAFAPPGDRCPGLEFGVAHGYAVASVEQLKVIDLVEGAPRLDALEASVDSRLADYRIVTWGDETPEEYVDSYCHLLSGFLAELPLDDLALEDSVWTPARLRDHEERARDIGRLSVIAAAVAPDGRLAGVSDLRLSTDDQGKAFIGITMVAREHRGHSLGLAMKLATHRELRSSYPRCRIVATSNAGVNEHMNAVNERMGYRVVEDLLDLQKVL
jgi:GNAT superfamily N-acetyltransferase/RimJ/RimL family protein N-acetyltransferase